MPRPVARRSAPAECPVCGAEVPPRAASCPECGADERTGWDEEATRYDGADLPDSAFEDDDASTSRPTRHGSAQRPARTGPHPLWLLVGAAVLLAIIGRSLALF